MSSVAALRPHLERSFESHRIVIWHDPERQPNGKSDIGKRISI